MRAAARHDEFAATLLRRQQRFGGDGRLAQQPRFACRGDAVADEVCRHILDDRRSAFLLAFTVADLKHQNADRARQKRHRVGPGATRLQTVFPGDHDMIGVERQLARRHDKDRAACPRQHIARVRVPGPARVDAFRSPPRHGQVGGEGFTVSAIEQDDDAVTIRGDAGAVVRARYVVGADGGSGFTRRTLCESVDDYGFQENWLVCDFKIRRDVPGLPMFRQICNPAQPTSIVRIGPEHHRFSFMLNPGETPEEAVEPARVWARVGPYLSQDDADMIRVVNYMFRSRIADQWRQGRVLLAGDAAHEMPPFLGQGMCSGIRDSHNIAWKLDLVLTGKADAAVLDTYQTEREPHVRFITEKAIALGSVQTIRDPAAARARDTRLLAERAADQKPEKLKFPALSSRLVANSGAVFPQGFVHIGKRAGRFDDIVGAGWRIVAWRPGVLAHLTDAHRDAWSDIGGEIALFGATGDAALVDSDGIYEAWFAAESGMAVIVRPDWHVYGVAADSSALAELLERLQNELQRPPAAKTRHVEMRVDA